MDNPTDKSLGSPAPTEIPRRPGNSRLLAMLAAAEKIIIILEELLLVLIVLEIFVTVQTHLEGGRLQLEPFIIVGIIAIIRHILSVVVRLTIPVNPAESRQQLTELAIYAGSAFILVAALALTRWSRRRPALIPARSRRHPRGPSTRRTHRRGNDPGRGSHRRGDRTPPGRRCALPC